MPTVAPGATDALCRRFGDRSIVPGDPWYDAEPALWNA